MLLNLNSAAGWVIDIVFIVLLIIGTVGGIRKGFIAFTLKLASTLVALIFAITFAVSFGDFLESVFGMNTAIANGLTNWMSGNETLSVALTQDTSGAELSNALSELGVGSFYSWVLSLGFGSMETIPAGTTPAMLLGSTFAKWICVAISFVSLFLLIKIGLWLIGKILTAFVDKVAFLSVLNQLLGGLFGLTMALISALFLLMVLNALPIDALQATLSSTNLVGAIVSSEWFESVTTYAVSGQWFDEFITNQLS